MRNQNNNKVAQIIGGHEKELCLICKKLAEKGYDVSFTYDDPSTGREIAADIEKKGVSSSSAKLLDYSPEELSSAIVETAEKMGGIDILIYMGSLPEGYEADGKLLLDLDEGDWDISMDRCAKGFFLSCKFALPYLISRTGAGIAAIDTNAGDGNTLGERSLTAFVSSRTLKALTEHLETELSYYGIDVAYHPSCGSWIEDMTG